MSSDLEYVFEDVRVIQPLKGHYEIPFQKLMIILSRDSEQAPELDSGPRHTTSVPEATRQEDELPIELISLTDRRVLTSGLDQDF
jgi:hypothetical protein